MVNHKSLPEESIFPIASSFKSTNSCDVSSNTSNLSLHGCRKGLQYLLENQQSVDLFEQFLKKNGYETLSLDLLFGVRGLKKNYLNDQMKVHKLINSLYKKKVKRITCISARIKEQIRIKLSLRVDLDVGIFDEAVKEVEEYMFRTTYQQFRTSNIFMLQQCRENKEMKGKQVIPLTRVATSVSGMNNNNQEVQEYVRHPVINKDGLYCSNSICPPQFSLSSGGKTNQNPEEFAAVLTEKLNRLLVHVKENSKEKQTADHLEEAIMQPIQRGFQKQGPLSYSRQRLNRIKKLLKLTSRSKEPKKTEAFPCESLDRGKQLTISRTYVPYTYVPNEDNSEYILDQHISRMLPDSGATPPKSPTWDTSLNRAMPFSDLSKVGLPSPYSMSYTGKIRKNADTYSKDSVFSSSLRTIVEDKNYQYHKNSESNTQVPDEKFQVKGSGCYKKFYKTNCQLKNRDSGYESLTTNLSTSKSSLDTIQETFKVISYKTVKSIQEDAGRAMMGKLKRKPSQKSYPSTVTCDASGIPNESHMTIVGYSYGQNSMPYVFKLPGKDITLWQFKSYLNKKGNFRYFFKQINDEFGTGSVLVEISDDKEILPLWGGKVFCIIESMDNRMARP